MRADLAVRKEHGRCLENTLTRCLSVYPLYCIYRIKLRYGRARVLAQPNVRERRTRPAFRFRETIKTQSSAGIPLPGMMQLCRAGNRQPSSCFLPPLPNRGRSAPGDYGTTSKHRSCCSWRKWKCATVIWSTLLPVKMDLDKTATLAIASTYLLRSVWQCSATRRARARADVLAPLFACSRVKI